MSSARTVQRKHSSYRETEKNSPAPLKRSVNEDIEEVMKKAIPEIEIEKPKEKEKEKEYKPVKKRKSKEI